MPAARVLGPGDQRRVQALAHFLRLLVQSLLRHFLPGEPQIARHGNHPQPHRSASREANGALVSVVVVCLERAGDGFVREIAGRDDVREGSPADSAVLRLLARCNSMKLRYRPWKRWNGCSALTTPAPCVQRLPAPAASVNTATSPRREPSAPAFATGLVNPLPVPRARPRGRRLR